MSELPTVRGATPADESELLSLLNEMHVENGMFSLSESKLRDVVARAVRPNLHAPGASPIVAGVIGDPGRVEASIGLTLGQWWYTDDWHIEDIWNYVRVPYRQSKNAKALIEFSKQAQAKMKMKLMVGVLSHTRTAAKIHLFERRLGPMVGAIFSWPPQG